MTRLSAALGVVLAIMLAIGWGFMERSWRQDALRDLKAARLEVDVLQLARAQATAAAAELDKHLRRVAADRDRWAELARETNNLEGANEPLSPYLRGVLDRLR